jgi:hypothetical protein
VYKAGHLDDVPLFGVLISGKTGSADKVVEDPAVSGELSACVQNPEESTRNAMKSSIFPQIFPRIFRILLIRRYMRMGMWDPRAESTYAPCNRGYGFHV